MKLRLSFLIMLLNLSVLYAQENDVGYHVEYHWDKPCEDKKIQKYFKQTTFPDSLSIISYLNAGKNWAISQSYWAFSIDSLVFSFGQKCIAYIHLGNAYRCLKVRYLPEYESVLRKVKSKYLSKKMTLNNIEQENQKVVQYLQNNAFPFGKVKLDSLSFQEDTAYAFLNIERGQYTQFNTFKIEGDLKLSNSFLYGYTGIKPNKPYQHSQITSLRSHLNKLTFVQVSQSPKILVDSNLVDVTLYADKKKGNRFDGILGILPNDKTTGKLLITGELNIFVQNLFRNGESTKFIWKKLQSNSQDLDIQSIIPYIAGTHLGTDVSFVVHKQDSSFVNTQGRAALLYFLGGQNFVGLRYQLKNSSVLNAELSEQKGFRSTRIGSYGLVFKSERLDFPQNPMRGYSIDFHTSVGKKEHKKSEASILQTEGVFKGVVYIPVFKQSTLVISNQTGSIISESIYNNELFQIGGLKTLRGFVESSIYASTYSLVSLEYRFIFEQKSALFAFVNGAWVEKNQKNYYQDFPYGFGIGMFFNTKAGVFSISYALGKQQNEHIQLKNSKIHFGIINQF